MKFVLVGPKIEVNSYSTLHDEKNAVEQFLNRTAQEAICCLDTQEPSYDPSTTPNEVPTEKISNPHDQTVDQVPHTYQAAKHEYPTTLIEISTNLTCHVAQPLQAKHESLVDKGPNHDLAGSVVLFISSSDRKPHQPHNMDHSI